MADSLANYLRRFRRAAGFSQEEVGKLSGQPRSTVARHERGKQHPSLAAVIAYEVVYDRPLRTLFRGTYGEIERTVRENAKHLFDEMPSSGGGRKVSALSRIAYPNDPVIVPLSPEWEESSES